MRTAHHEIGNVLEPGDLLITLGAGNVHEIGAQIIRDLKMLEDLSGVIPEPEMSASLYEPMRKHTTLLVGGPAQFWFQPHSFLAFASVVESCRARGIPLRVVGRGSNLLIRDGGIRGAVIQPTGGAFSELSVDEEGLVTAGVGVRLKKLASFAGSQGLGGFEWMEGIPGNVGGSLRMNAGAMGIETFDQVVRVTFLDEDGVIRTRERDDIIAEYRNVRELRRNFALQAVFKGQIDRPEHIKERWEESRQKRKKTQPVAASAGCTFKNPAELPAGRLIDELGLKGERIETAEVSNVHGNFIVNKGHAKAADVLALIAKVQGLASEKMGISLETEVKVIGEDEYTF